MTPVIKVIGNRIELKGEFGTSALQLDDNVKAKWKSWHDRYQSITEPDNQGQLTLIGLEMFGWLDQSGWATKWLNSHGVRQLEIKADASITDDQFRLLDLPWELLADKNGFLAADSIQPFEVWRRVGSKAEPSPPKYKNMSLMFMASAPRNVQPELNYELEETAILRATEGLNLALFVEESGCPELLRQRTLRHECYDAFHFSCHGDVISEDQAHHFSSEGAQAGPNLLMETEEGDRAFIPPAVLAEIWQGVPPQFIFLSACKTSQNQWEKQDAYTSQLVRAVPAVLGWGGSVYDTDAIEFAATFYQALAGARDVTFAAAYARRKVLSKVSEGTNKGSHWHLARLWLGPQGGGPICAADGDSRDIVQNDGSKRFLDPKRKRGPVAGPFTFVGRRRHTQDLIRIMRQNESLGAVILGMGNFGKSSLAARVAGRLIHLNAIVIFDDYDACSILKILIDQIDVNLREEFSEQWMPRISESPEKLALALESLLTGPFRDQPVLLIIDDLEQILNDPQPGEDQTTLKSEYGYSQSIVAVLTAFKKARVQSRLLFTSRYAFSAIDETGCDLARDLATVHLEPFSGHEQERQWQAELTLRLVSHDSNTRTSAQKAIGHEDYSELKAQAITLANGNPGLQDLFARPLFSADFVPVRSTLGAMAYYLKNPQLLPDEDNALFEFFRRMTFDKYQNALTETQKVFLRAATVFGDGIWPERVMTLAEAALARFQSDVTPVPAEMLHAVGTAAGVGEIDQARQRVTGLGLLDVYPKSLTGRTEPEFLVNPFARPLLSPLNDEERAALASATFPVLEKIWAKDNDIWPQDGRSVEALRLAFLAETKK